MENAGILNGETAAMSVAETGYKGHYDMAILTAISFCTGYDGIGLGLARTGLDIRTLCYVEREAFAAANLVAKIKSGQLDDAPIWCSVTDFPSKLFTGKVDLLHGGYPCQGESVAGKRNGAEDHRWLWDDFARAISIITPRFVFFENVEGHISMGLRRVLADLVGLGYSVENSSGEPTWGVFSASEVGAPHQRKRVFILGKLADSSKRKNNGRKPGDVCKKNGRPGGTLSRFAGQSSEGELALSGGAGLEGGELPGALGERARASRPIGECGGDGIMAVAFVDGCVGRPISDEIREREIQEPAQSQRGISGVRREIVRRSDRWPSRPGEPQYEWEPPRTTGGRAAESTMGGNADGYPAELVQSTSRTDELRLLGNGVVPAVAALAWKVLMGKLE